MVPVTQSHEHYNYRDYLKTPLTYGTDAASSLLTHCYWNLDTGDMNPCDTMAGTHNSSKNDGFIARWSMLSSSRDVQIFGLFRTDLCNVPLFLIPLVKLQINLIKARASFCLINKTSDSKITYKFLDA